MRKKRRQTISLTLHSTSLEDIQKLNEQKLITIDPSDEKKTSKFPLNTASEQVVKFIIEKLISRTITDHFVNIVHRKLPDECFNHTKSIINTYIQSQFIPYDRDEPHSEMQKKPNFTIEEDIMKRTESSFNDPNLVNQNKSPENDGNLNNENLNNENLNMNKYNNIDLTNKFYDNFYRGDNNWLMINEPATLVKDRHAYNEIMYSQLSNSSNTSNANSNINLINKKIKPNGTDLPNVTEEEPALSEEPVKKVKKKLSSLMVSKKEKEKSSLDQNAKPKKKTLQELMNEFSFYDIKNLDVRKEEDENLKKLISELRKEKEEEMKKKEADKKIVVQKQKEKEIKTVEEKNNFNNLHKKKITVDANGNIVFIKPIRPEKLYRDFNIASTKLKNFNTKGDGKKKGKKKVGLNLQVDTNSTNQEGEMVIQNNTMDDQKDIVNNTSLNTAPNLPKLTNKQNTKSNNSNVVPIKLSNVNNKNLFPYDTNDNLKLKRKMEKGPILPSGSCFEQIALECGVVMTENKKQKSGGKDFQKKFNKYSIETYNKQLKDVLATNYLNTISAFKPQNTINSFNMDNTYTNSNNNNMFASNTIGSNNMMETNNLSNINNYNNTSSNLFLNNYHKKSVSLLSERMGLNGSNGINAGSQYLNTESFCPSININPLNAFSLKSALEYEDDDLKNKTLLTSRGLTVKNNPINLYNNMTLSNFKKNKKNDYQLTEMNNFAMTLVTKFDDNNKFPGTNKINKGYKLPNKPIKSQIQKEVGIQVINNSIHLPRERSNFMKTHMKFALSTDFNRMISKKNII